MTAIGRRITATAIACRLALFVKADILTSSLWSGRKFPKLSAVFNPHTLMALIFSVNSRIHYKPFSTTNPNSQFNHSQQFVQVSTATGWKLRRRLMVFNNSGEDSPQSGKDETEVNNLGVKAALSMLKFYKREISPLMPNSCRYIPTCSEYSMIAYKKYGVVKGTVLTAWRLCRCNPLGGSGYDPPRWFDEPAPPEQ